MTILQTHEIPQERFDPDKLRDAGFKVGDGPENLEDRILANIDSHRQRQRDRKERAALTRSRPMSAHRRKDLEDRERFLIRTLRHIDSPAIRAVHLTEAKRIADQLSADGFCVRAADRLGVAKRTVERALALGVRLLPDLAEAVAGGPYDNANDLERLAGLPLDKQCVFAREAADRQKATAALSKRLILRRAAGLSELFRPILVRTHRTLLRNASS